MPEHPLRLANYALFCAAPGCALAERALELAAARLGARAGAGCDDEYGVLFTSGPDVVSEAVQGAREAVTFGARGADAAPLAGVAVLDPGPLIVNANSFTWRGHGNPALAEPPD